MSNTRKLLVVDDEPDIGQFVCDVAEGVGLEGISCQYPEEFEKIFTDDIDVLVLDLVMPKRDGVEILRSVASIGADTNIILISGYDDTILHSAQKLATERGLNVVGSLAKPIRIAGLEKLLCRILNPIYYCDIYKEKPSFSPRSCELNKAISNGDLVAYFQPQLDIKSERLVGMEALVRWQYPAHGLIGPDVILSLAEESNSMDGLSNEMLSQSLYQLKQLQDEGIVTRVSINMAPSNFHDLNLPEAIEELIIRHGLEPGQVVLEITESTLMQELVESLDILTRLRMKGVKLSIDDFGTGYSSMVQLYRIPFSEIKIDRSFVLNAIEDPEALAIVKMTIRLAHELGMVVIAEGVENKETWDLLKALGCDIAQGYYKAEPMPADDLIKWLKQQNRHGVVAGSMC